MTYSGDIGSLRFLGADVIYQLTHAMLSGDDESDRGALDDAVLLLDVVSSYQTEKDPIFTAEAAAIREERLAALKGLSKGMELAPSTQESFRWRELKAMFRSLCRQGVFVRQESQETEWRPTKHKGT